MYEKGVRIQTLSAQLPAELCTTENQLQNICNIPVDPCENNGLVVSNYLFIAS